MKRIIILTFLMTFLASCSSVSTTEPEKAFEYWSGIEPPKEIELIKGEYYQSPHFFLEYELFLKFKSDKKWWNEFIEYNQLELDSLNNNWDKFTALPEWFKPTEQYLIYSKNDEFDRSRYFINNENGICYLYETVGM